MRIPRFYQANPFQPGERHTLSEENFRHAIKVLRLGPEAPLILFNGEGGEYHAHLQEVDKRQAHVMIDRFDPVTRESALTTTLVLALIKPDRMDYAIQKAVELGVAEIQPVFTERSVVRLKADRQRKKLEHWQGIIQAACEQSGRTRIPLLHPIESLPGYLQAPWSGESLCMLPGSSHSLQDIPAAARMRLLVGPEGGFTGTEEAMFEDNDIRGIHFGPRILRAETAVIAGLSCLQQQFGDLS